MARDRATAEAVGGQHVARHLGTRAGTPTRRGRQRRRKNRQEREMKPRGFRNVKVGMMSGLLRSVVALTTVGLVAGVIALGANQTSPASRSGRRSAAAPVAR